MAKNKKQAKEIRGRKNIATLLSLMGFHDDDPAATIKIMRERLKKIQERSKFKKPESSVRKIIFKCGGKTTTVVPLKPKPLVPLAVSNVDHLDKQITYSEKNPFISYCYNNKENMMIDHNQDSAQSLINKGCKSNDLKNSNNVCSENFDQMMNDDGGLHNFIKGIGGSKAKLVMEKVLTSTDVTKGQGRLLMPRGDVENSGFLTDDEKSKLVKGQDLSVQVFDPQRREWTVNFKRWNMAQKVYVLKTAWNDIVKANGLEKDMVIQVWAFRVNQKLCFALVTV